MSTAPSNPTRTADTFRWSWLLEFVLFNGSEFVPTVEATTVPLGESFILVGACNAGILAGTAPAEHGVVRGAPYYKGCSVIVNLSTEPFAPT